MSVLTFDLYASTKRDRSMREVGERDAWMKEGISIWFQGYILLLSNDADGGWNTNSCLSVCSTGGLKG